MTENRGVHKTNRVVLMVCWLVDVVLIAGYTLEAIQGGKTVGFALLVTLLLLVPIIIATILYRRNQASRYMRTVILVGYYIFYNVAIFSSDVLVTFVYFFPIMGMFFLYYELYLVGIFGLTVLIANSAHIGWLIWKQGTGYSSDYTIVLGTVLLFSISMLLATRLSNQFNQEKLETIGEEKNKLQAILDEVSTSAQQLNDLAQQMQNTSQAVASTMQQISASTEEIAAGMEEVLSSMEYVSASSGEINTSLGVLTAEAADGAQSASQIKDHAAAMENNALTARNKTHNMQQTINERVTAAIGQARVVEEISSLATSIGAIADQTNLLALNAAIEAARAGDAGRGFAVVAEEVRKLAEESSQSVSSIQSLTNQVQGAVDNLITNVSSMLEFIRQDIMQDYSTFVDIIQKSSSDADLFAGITSHSSQSNAQLQTAVENISQAIASVSVTLGQSTEGTQEIARASSSAAEAALAANRAALQLAEQSAKLARLAQQAQN